MPMMIGPYSFEEYLRKVESFHGSIAPGMIAGGIMVDLALRHLPEGEFFDVLCETAHCLPDAVQLLTPCTIGNGWLKIVNLTRFACTVYNKYNGEGTRAFLDSEKITKWEEISCWFFAEKPKSEQNLDRLMQEFRKGGDGICSIGKVRVASCFVTGQEKEKKTVRICPGCHEAFKSNRGEYCPACKGENPYVS